MRPIRLTEHLAREARAVERDRRRPPVGSEVPPPIRTSTFVQVGLGSDTGTGSVSVSGVLPVPRSGVWMVVVTVQVTLYDAAVVAPGRWSASISSGSSWRALAFGGDTEGERVGLLVPSGAGNIPVAADAELVDTGDDVSITASVTAAYLGPYAA